MSESEIIDVVLAHAQGRKIQQRDKDHRELGWRECPFPNWDFYRVEFRVEPRENPIEKWMLMRRNGGWSWFDTKREAENHRDIETTEIVHLREVIE